MLRVAICDDEQASRERLTVLLRQFPDLELAGAFDTAEALLEAVRNRSPDLLFLDLEMPNGCGFEVVEALGTIDWMFSSHPPLVLFLTDTHFAITAFDCGAVGILNKPIVLPALRRCVQEAERALRHHEARQRLFHLKSRLDEVRSHYASAAGSRVIIGLDGGRRTRIPVSSISWIEAHAGTYVQLHCGRRSYLKQASLNSMTESLLGAGFIRIHRGILVNAKAVASTQSDGWGLRSVRLKSGEWLPISRPYRTAARVLA